MNVQKVDHSAIRTNQAGIILLLVLAFVLNSAALVGFVALFMLGGTLLGKPGFAFLYTRLLRPLRLVRPDVIPDNPEPHRFAQGFGGVVVLIALLGLVLGAPPILAWALAWMVVALAALNLFVGFCAGCAIYYWLNRLNVPGFTRRAPEGILPGLNPHSAAARLGKERNS